MPPMFKTLAVSLCLVGPIAADVQEDRATRFAVAKDYGTSTVADMQYRACH